MIQCTEVVFRMWGERGDVGLIALFPYEIATFTGLCSSYERVGQHAAASYSHVMQHSRPATELEYLELKAELENIGYKLKVIKRCNHEQFIKAWEKMRLEILSGRLERVKEKARKGYAGEIR